MCDERTSDSALVERIWRYHSAATAASFISMAEIHCGIVVTKCRGKTTLTVRGPETKATPAHCPADAEFLGIMFSFGACMPHLPAGMVMDRRDVNLPEATRTSFWLNGSAWHYPNHENVDAFVERLVREGVLVHHPVGEAVLQGQPAERSARTVQRRFLQTTGLTCTAARQIARARYALTLLKRGVPILDVVHEAGYFDQPHLTRSVKHFIGLTPARIIDEARAVPLSFLYKTAPISEARIRMFQQVRSGSAASPRC
jgi:AraC-like DNA-binding protein